jgi:hypothetical protein
MPSLSRWHLRPLFSGYSKALQSSQLKNRCAYRTKYSKDATFMYYLR